MATSTLSTDDWAALGAVAEGPTHGFAVAKLLAEDGPLGQVWTLQRNEVYNALKKLTKLELISEQTTEPGRGPTRTILRATTTGKRRLRRWLVEPVDHVRDVRSLLLLKLLLLDRSHRDPTPALLHWRIGGGGHEPVVMRFSSPRPPIEAGRSAFAGYRFPPDVILLAVRWYLRFGLSYRDLEELLAERGVEVDHVTLYRWVQHFIPLAVEAAGPCRHSAGGRWFVDETYVKVAGVWRYVCRAVDESGQVIDVLVSSRRDVGAARRFFAGMLEVHEDPEEVTTDRAPALGAVIAELLPATVHDTEQYANNRIEADHGRLKARLRPMRGLKTLRAARVIIRGHAFIQNLGRGHYELGVEARDRQLRAAAAFDQLARAI